MPPELVWYASYGSNLDSDRFMTYIEGGMPKGGSHAHRGCANKTPPRATAILELPHALYFAGQSWVWRNPEDQDREDYESGLAFINIKPTEDPSNWTKVKAYLITLRQLEDVTAQEAKVAAIDPIDIGRLRRRRHLPVGAGSQYYDELIYCGEFEGHPIISFTSSVLLQPFTKPSRPYLHVIGSGLIASHAVSAEQVAGYLRTKAGIAGNYTERELAELAHLAAPASSQA